MSQTPGVRHLLIVVAVTLAVGIVGLMVLTGSATAQQSAPNCSEVGYDGNGSLANPYEIENVSQLQCLGHENSTTTLNDNFELISDIDATQTRYWNGGAGFEPIAHCGGEYTAPYKPCEWSTGEVDWNPFTGTFDGNGHLIENLTINRPGSSSVALFESGDDAVFSNIRMTGVNYTGNRSTAGLISYLEGSDVSDPSAGSIINVSVSGTIEGDIGVAGIAAVPADALMINQNAFVGNVTGSDHVGGVAARTRYNTEINTTYVQGKIVGHGDGRVYTEDADGVEAGGLVGNSGVSSHFDNLYTAVTVSVPTADDYAGAILGGHRDQDTFNTTYWDQDIGPDQAIGTYNATGITSLHTAEMQDEAAEGNMSLDFESIWQIIPEDYPVFQWEVEAAGEVEITGTVTDELDGSPIEGATVEAGNDTAITNATGQYTLNVSEFGDEVVAIADETVDDVDEYFTITGSKVVDSPQEGDVVNISLDPDYAGSGTAADPYKIQNLEDLQQVRYELDAHYEVVSDIDATPTAQWFEGQGFDPLGAAPEGKNDDNFNATFDGNGHAIENLTIDRPDEIRVGLFGLARNARIENVRLENVDVVGKGDPTAPKSVVAGLGGLVGAIYENNGEVWIENVSVTGDVAINETSQNYNTGGIVGFSTGENEDPQIDNQNVFRGNVTGWRQVGGILGRSGQNTAIGTSYVQGTVEGDQTVGGIVGHSSAKNSVFQSMYAAVTVRGNDSGAIVGEVAASGDNFTESVYWDQQLEADAYGTVTAGTPKLEMTPLNTSQMTDEAARENMSLLDFTSTWQVLPEDYPVFGWEAQIVVEINGTVVDALDGDTIGGATVEAGNDTAVTDQNGDFTLNVTVIGDRVMAVADETVDDVDEYFTITGSKVLPEPEEGDQITVALTPDYEGNGTAANPYLVKDPEDLQQIRYDLDAHYALTQDIDASETAQWFDGRGFEPIRPHFSPVSETSGPFSASLSGNGHTISGLTIDRTGPEQRVGLFTRVSGAVITNLHLADVDVSGSYYTGGLAGEVLHEAIVRNASVSGAVNGAGRVGGLTGRVVYSRIERSATKTSVTANDDGAGGLVGEIHGGVISHSYATGEVSGQDQVGGLVGSIEVVRRVPRPQAETADVRTGIVRSYATGDSTGDARVGGLVGYQGSGLLLETYAVGTPAGSQDVGGLVGQTDVGGDGVNRSYWDVQASGEADGIGSISGSVSGLTGLSSTNMTGEDAPQAMTGFDFDATWDTVAAKTCNMGSYPVLVENRQVPEPGLSSLATPSFAVTITDAPQEVLFGTSMRVDYRVKNRCENAAGTTDVEFTVGNRVEGTDADVELPGGGAATGSFTYTPTGDDIPQFTVGVRAGGSRDAATVVITEPEVDPADFGVAITSTNTPVTEGETVQIGANVSNSGDESGTTEVTFAIDGTVVDSREVSLSGDETVQVDGFWDTAVGDAGDHELTVAAGDDNDTRTITVEELPPAEFVVEITDTNAPVEAGQTLEVTVTITNVGEQAGTKVVDFGIVDGVDETGEFSLDPEESTSVTFEWPTERDEAGTYTAFGESEDGRDEAEVTIGEFEAPHFAVNITDIAGPVTEGETLRINASVTNEGEVPDRQEVTLEINGTVVYRENLSLQPGEIRNISADWQPPAGTLGEQPVEIESADDNMTASALVEAVEEEPTETDTGISRALLLLMLLLLLVILAVGYYYYRRRRQEAG